MLGMHHLVASPDHRLDPYSGATESVPANSLASPVPSMPSVQVSDDRSRLAAWSDAALLCMPAELTDCFGTVVRLQAPHSLNWSSESSVAQEAIEQTRAVQSSRRMMSVVDARSMKSSLNLASFMRPQGPMKEKRLATFAAVLTTRDLQELSTVGIASTTVENLVDASSKNAASNFDAWAEWTLALGFSPFRWYWILADRMPTAALIAEESLLTNFQAYLAERMDHGSASNVLAAVRSFHRDVLAAAGASTQPIFKRQFELSAKSQMKDNPMRRRRDVLAPPVLRVLVNFWEQSALQADADQNWVQAVHLTMNQMIIAAGFTPGFRIHSICPGQADWSADGMRERRSYWTLRTLMQLEQLLPVTERPDGPIAQHEDQDNWTDDAQRYILIPPPLQKVTYMSQMTNEVATRPWPHRLSDNVLSLPATYFRLMARLDAWHPSWRQEAGRAPAIFDPYQKGSYPALAPLSPQECHTRLQQVVMAALPDDMHDLVIGDQTIRLATHTAWSEIVVVVPTSAGQQFRKLLPEERDRALARGPSSLGVQGNGSARHYDNADIAWLMDCADAALVVTFQAASSIRLGAPVDHSGPNDLTASHVEARTGVDGAAGANQALASAEAAIAAAQNGRALARQALERL